MVYTLETSVVMFTLIVATATPPNDVDAVSLPSSLVVNAGTISVLMMLTSSSIAAIVYSV